MHLYGNANLRGEIVLGSKNIIQIEEELIYHTNANTPIGEYYFVEKSVPDGYKIIKDKNLFSICEEKNEDISFNTGRYNNAPKAVIDISPDREGYKIGQKITFSAKNSSDDTGIKSYEWIFGDGKKVKGETVTHTYYNGDIYNVALRITDEDGAIATAIKTIEVAEDAECYRKVTINVKSSKTGELLKNTYVYVTDENSDVIWEGSAEAGTLKLNLLKDNYFTITAYKYGYNVRSTTINVSEDGDMNLYLLSSEVILSEVTVTEMTYDEMVAEGVDIYSDDNNNIYKFETLLSFYEYMEPIEIKIYGGETGNCNPKGTVTTGDGNLKVIPFNRGRCVYFLIIDGTTKWLKDMFHVQLLVYNTSTNEFVKDCSAELILPEGLSFASMEDRVTDDAIKNIGKIEKSSQGYAEWFVRGDIEGVYNIATKVDGSMETADENSGSIKTDSTEFEYIFNCEEPLRVSSTTALSLDIYADEYTSTGSVYDVQYVYTNVSSNPIYGMQFYFNREIQSSDEDGDFYNEELDVYGEHIFCNIDYETLTINKIKDGNIVETETIGGENYFTCTQLNQGESIKITFTTVILFKDLVNENGVFVEKDVDVQLGAIGQSMLPGSTANISTTCHINHIPIKQKNYLDNLSPALNIFAGDPVNLLTGEFCYDYTDASVDGRHKLELERKYYSGIKEDIGFGYGWITNYYYELVEYQDDWIIIKNPTGTNYNLVKASDGKYYGSDVSKKYVSKTSDGYLFVDDCTKYIFDSQGQIKEIIEEDGWKISYTYLNGRIKTISSNAGTLTFNTNEKAKYTSVEINGKNIKYTYNDGTLISVTNMDHDTMNYSYDKYHNLVGITDFEGVTTIKNTYDSYCKRNSNSEYYYYNSKRNIISKKDEAGNIVEYTYGPDGNIICEMTSEGYETKYSYNAAGLVATKTDANGNVTYYNYDDFGRVIKETYGNGKTKEYTYSDARKLLGEKDENDNTIEYVVNKNGYITSIKDKRNYVSSTSYNAQSRVCTKQSSEGYVTSYRYDECGNLISEQNANGEKITYEYDSDEKIIKKTDAVGNEWKYTYDEKGRLAAEIDPYENSEKYILHMMYGEILKKMKPYR